MERLSVFGVFWEFLGFFEFQSGVSGEIWLGFLGGWLSEGFGIGVALEFGFEVG
jgi:hypothetical protein